MDYNIQITLGRGEGIKIPLPESVNQDHAMRMTREVAHEAAKGVPVSIAVLYDGQVKIYDASIVRPD